MPSRWNRPSVRLSRAIGRSPCSTCTSTLGWLSAAVENVSLLRVGIVVLRGMSVVITPPSVSMPSESGVTSSSSRSLTSPASTPACTAAPTATTSSGLTPLCGSLPNRSRTICCTRGMRVDPPTSTTSSICDGLQARVRERLLHRADRPLQQVFDQLLELRARQLHLQVLGPAGVRGDERQVDFALHHRGQFHLGLLRRLPQPLQRHPVLAEVDAVALPELGDDPVDDALVEVVAAEVRVAVGRLHLDDALAHLEDRDVEGAAAEVVDGDRLVLLLVEAVGQRRRRRLVDDAHDLEAGDRARLLRGLALRVVEVRRHRDDRLRHRLAEVLLGGLLQLLQHHGGDLRGGRRSSLPPDLHLHHDVVAVAPDADRAPSSSPRSLPRSGAP